MGGDYRVACCMYRQRKAIAITIPIFASALYGFIVGDANRPLAPPNRILTLQKAKIAPDTLLRPRPSYAVGLSL
jgi:hypothetical protein